MLINIHLNSIPPRCPFLHLCSLQASVISQKLCPFRRTLAGHHKEEGKPRVIKEPAACHVLLFETMDGPLDEVLENKSREGRLLLGEEGDLIIRVGSLLSPG